MAAVTVVEVTILQSWNMGLPLFMKLGYDDVQLQKCMI